MRRSMVAANWKMNGDLASNAELADAFAEKINTDQVDVVVFAPHVYLSALSQKLASSTISVGGQNASVADKGAYTGETALYMLKEVGCTHVLTGHSERRTLYAEDDQIVAEKTQAALQAGLTPVFCIGETLAERESGITEQVVAKQIQAVIDAVGIKAFSNIVVAYEPVWAIGTGVTASAEQAQAVHAFIRAMFAKQDAEIADKLVILYGGSMKAANAAELIGQKDIDGGLVGGASLIVDEFVAICQAAG
jgi:triosephosphate isomerase (TIM)